MRIGQPSPMPPAMIDAQIDVALEKKSQDQIKAQGELMVDMIDDVGINRPLSEGTVGRNINVRI